MAINPFSLANGAVHLASRLKNYRRILLSRFASRWIEKIRLSNWTVLELGQKESALTFPRPRKRLKGGRSLFLTSGGKEEFPQADLVVFLGLAERLEEEDLSRLLERISSRRVLFSYCEVPANNALLSGIYRKIKFKTSPASVFYRPEQIRGLLEKHGYKQCEVRSLPWFDPAKLVLAQRHRRPPVAGGSH